MQGDLKELRNLNFNNLLPTVDVRPEFVVMTEYNYCAAFLLRLFERQHLLLYDNYLNVSQKHETYKEAIKQKWTTQKLINELGAVYRARGIPSALKLLHKKGFIIHEYAMNGKAYVGHDVYFNVLEVQKAIVHKFGEVRQAVSTGMGTEKLRQHPKRGRPFGSVNKVKNVE